MIAREQLQLPMRFRHHAAILPLLLLTAFLAARPTPAYADHVLLTYGDRVSGHIISVSKEVVRIETPASGIVDIQRRYVEQIATDEPRFVDLVSGERVVGQLATAEEKIVIIRSSLLGDRRVPLDAIDTVQPPEGSKDPQPLAQVQGRGAAANPAQVQQPAIGQRPEDVGDIRKIFLRQSTVLLRPGQLETEAAFSYQHTQVVSTLLNARFRQFEIPLAIRVGLFDRGEGFLTVPAAYLRRDLGFAGSGASNNEAGLGDVSAGLNYELARETARRPDIIASISAGEPTGSKPNEQGLSLGAGNWSASGGVQFIKTADPVALFWGVSYTHGFSARYFLGDAEHDVDPGETVAYNFGFGFAVNGDISLSTQVRANYQSDTKADGQKIFASSREPASFRSALTYRYSKAIYIEPSVTIGLDRDTPDFALGLSLTYRFGK
jgi:Putative MetA-pathway of phenol degradation